MVSTNNMNKRVTGMILVTMAVMGIVFFSCPDFAHAASGFESQVNTGTTDITNLLKRIAPGLIVAVITIAALALLGPRKLRDWAQDHIGYAILAVFVICIAASGVTYFFDLFGS
ncbi:TrbC/VirB2 family protein [Listeria seeligeri]|uniref:TrbC/VirB2 family protein n=1 Tax=Listeria seeligeri TaxID=1640 RepID=UPI001888CE1E|nr:TrbC/VirB2 family protein [Listeria seeligeri]MBF2356037.1 hypothetical protein [Listeria seeligeri]